MPRLSQGRLASTRLSLALGLAVRRLGSVAAGRETPGSDALNADRSPGALATTARPLSVEAVARGTDGSSTSCLPPARACSAKARVASTIVRPRPPLPGEGSFCRPEIRRDYPLNLSISLSGGKETNMDSRSNGE